MAQLVLKLLGPLEMTLDGQPVDCRYDKVRALLAYLAVEAGHAHRRETLLGLLWPDLPEAAARNNLRQALATLRHALGDGRTLLLADRTVVRFDPAASCQLDVAIFTALLDACDHHAHRRAESCKICAERLTQAVALYRGPFLAEFFLPDSDAFETWVTIKREQVHQQMLAALARLVVYHERRGYYAEALAYARRQLILEPWWEEAHRQIMRLHLLSGDRNAALAQYHHCQEVLEAELGVPPEEATTALFEQIYASDAAGAKDHQMAPAQLAAPAARPHTLPPQPTPFIGRERELAELGELLANPDCRLVTLTGPGGVGKTRLALQAATEHVDEYADGVFFVPLAGLEAPELLAHAISGALQLQEGATGDLVAWLCEHLQDKEMLLVLDNMEHLLDGVGLLAEILRLAQDVTVLATSRERLNLQGEWLFVVDGLPVPQWPTNDMPPVQEFVANDAVQLFVQRARRVQHRFVLTAESATAIMRICRLTGGLPLAIELAATWARALTCAEIAEEIGRGIDVFTSTLRDLPERHRSLTAVFHHSWQLLSDDERTTLRRLSVFGGSFGREAAAQVVCAALPTLAALVDKSLLIWLPVGRYVLHTLVRQYAAEQLRAAGEAAEMHLRHLQYYLDLAEMAETKMNGPEQAQWLDRLEAENDNLRVALAWSQSAGRAESGLLLAVALYPFWYWRNHFHEGRKWLAEALALAAQAQPLSTVRQARALWAAGVLAELQGDYAPAAQCYTESLALRRNLGDQAGLAASLNSLGALHYRQHAYDRAQAFFEESLALRRALGQTKTLSIPLNNLGLTALALGKHARAEGYFAECLALARDAGDKGGMATVLNNLGTAMLVQGDARRARIYFAEGISLQQDLLDRDGLAGCLEGAAVAVLMQAPNTETSLWAARLLGAAEALREAVGAPILQVMKPLYEQAVATLRATLDEADFAAAWKVGRVLTVEEAIECAQVVSDIHEKDK